MDSRRPVTIWRKRSICRPSTFLDCAANGKAQRGATRNSTEESTLARAPGPDLDRTAANGNNAEPIRLYHLILNGGFHDRPCPPEPALAFPPPPLRPPRAPEPSSARPFLSHL